MTTLPDSTEAQPAGARHLDPWLLLAEFNTATQRTYEQLAESCWRSHDYLTAVRYRGIAEGLELARSNQLDVSRESRESGGVA